MSTIYDFSATTLDGAEQPLSAYRGQVLLVVNTASHCGFTAQYEGLEALWRRHHDQGLMVLGFPCNQFGAQEPGDAEEIRDFCTRHYDVTFPLFAKVEVNGPNTHPLFALLKSQGKGVLGTEAIKWNFTKFLIDRAGAVIDRYAPTVTPAALEQDIGRALTS